MGSQEDDRAGPPPALAFPDDQQLFDALGSEALIVQNKRSALTNEATSRSSLFVAIVSGALVAAGFVLRTSYAFSFLVVVLPIVLLLGAVTFFRLATIARDDRRLDAQLERIRDGFRALSPRGPAYLLHPQPPHGGRWTRAGAVITSAAGFVGLLDCALLGLGVALLTGIATGRPASAGAIVAGVVVSAIAAVLMVVVLARDVTPAHPGPAGTPGSA